MNFFIIGEISQGLQAWLLHDKAPTGMPAVYNLYQYLGQSTEHRFDAIIINKAINKTVTFPNGSTIHLYRLRLPNHFFWKFFSAIYVYRLTTTHLKHKPYDVLYTLGFYNFLSRPLGSKFNLFTVNRIFGNRMMDAVQRKDYFRLYTRFLFQTLALKFPADLQINTRDGTQTDKVAEWLRPGSTVYSLYNGMDRTLKKRLLALPVVERLPREEPIRMCYIARLGDSKRQDLGIAVVEELVHRLGATNIHLDIIGAGAYQSNLVKLIQAKHLSACISILPPVPHKDIPTVLARYHISLFCYDMGVLGNILWESMLAGRLLLVRAEGDVRIFNADNALLITNKENFVEQAAEKIERRIGEEVRIMGENARQLADQLIRSWDERFAAEMKLIIDTKRKKEEEG